MALDMTLEAQWAADRSQCLCSFIRAVDEAMFGKYAAGKELIERVRQRGGDRMAEIAREELRKHAALDHPPLQLPKRGAKA
jgi:hypothetical protein